jgi:hypothetical protein
MVNTTPLPLYPVYRGLGGPQGLFGRVWKISTPPWFDSGPFSPWQVDIPVELSWSPWTLVHIWQTQCVTFPKTDINKYTYKNLKFRTWDSQFVTFTAGYYGDQTTVGETCNISQAREKRESLEKLDVRSAEKRSLRIRGVDNTNNPSATFDVGLFEWFSSKNDSKSSTG